MLLNDHRLQRPFQLVPGSRAAILTLPKGWKGSKGAIPLYRNLIPSNSNIAVSNRLQWKTTLITPSNPSGRLI